MAPVPVGRYRARKMAGCCKRDTLASEVAYARASRDFDSAFAKLAERHVEAIVIAGDDLFVSELELLSRLAAPVGGASDLWPEPIAKRPGDNWDCGSVHSS
jgi:hypothetical protein